MKMMILAALILTAAQTSHAMSCDVSAIRLTCKSASGKYEASVLTCGWSNGVRDSDLKVAGQAVTAELETAWFGKNFTGLQFDLGERKVRFEMNNATKTGTVVDESQEYNPGPWQTLGDETIRCVETDLNEGRG